MVSAMSTGEGSDFVLLDELVTNFNDGWTIEIECTKSAEPYYAGYKGLWVVRRISHEGETKYLCTFRNRKKPRQIKTAAGVGRFIREDLGSSINIHGYDKGNIVRFNKDGPLP